MELRQLEYVVAVVDAGSFSGAAARLGVAQPSVSQAVRSLEVELGVALFERLHTGARPTAAARALEAPARQALRDARMAREAVASVASLVVGTLDLVCLPTLAVTPTAELVGRLRAEHDGLVVRLVQPESTDAVLQRVRDGRSEVGLTEVPDESVRWSDLAVHALADQELVALVPAGAAGAALPLRRLAELPVVTAPPGTSTRRLLDEALAARGAAPRIAVETDHREAIPALVAAGAGVALVPRGEVVPTGTAVRRLVPRLTRRIGVVHRHGPRSPAADAFLRLAVPSWPARPSRPRPRRR